jgi:hypothetical protein
MRRISIVVAVLIAAAAITATALAAVNVKTYPSATFGVPDAASVTLSSGNFSGLGNTPAFATLTAFGQATYQCSNNEGHVVPGQNPVAAQSGSTSPVGLGNADHNGRGNYPGGFASVTAPPTPTSQQVGCGGKGSGNWQVQLTGLQATCAELVISEGSTVIFSRTYTLGGPAIGTAGLTC